MGINTGDDAAVYRLTDDLCIVQTVDFFPPIVDDAYQFGAISAANSVSDIYAMGGKPLLALNLVCFPEDLPKRILGQILKGGADVAQEAGMLIVGGHTIQDKEPKYGMAVTGTIAPDKIVTNAGAKAGDVLVLTKPLGTGIITTAGKAQVAPKSSMDAAIASMRALNRDAAAAMLAVGVHACTDITGFGLIGHLMGMMKASNTTAQLQMSAIPLLPGARELVHRGIAPGGTRRNLTSVGAETHWHPDLGEEDRLLLCDAQTSGGLLLSVAAAKADALRRELRARGVLDAVIGHVGPAADAPIVVTP